ncbi:MAG: hypothetical protein AAB345_00255 [Patescibacteria group bacterium]
MRVIALFALIAGFVFADGTDENPEDTFKKENPTWITRTENAYHGDGSLYVSRKWSYKDGDTVAIELSGEYESKVSFTHAYDEQGRPTEKNVLGADDKLFAKYSYSYDKNGGHSVVVHTYDSDRKEELMSVIHYYDDKGHWTVRHTLMSTDVIGEMKNEFDKDSGLMTKSVVSWVLDGEKMTVTSEISYSYHKNGQLKERKEVSPTGSLREREVYDDKGGNLALEYYDANGDFARGIELTPTYVDSEDGKSMLRKSETWKVMQGKEKEVVDSGKTEVDYIVEK